MKNEIIPHKITKPIQLLSAWLFGLLLINSVFLSSAILIEQEYLSIALVWASIINVPLFLVSIFLLQTKFRPEMQEDTFYSTYLNSKTNSMNEISISKLIERKVEEIKYESIDEKSKIKIVEKNKITNLKIMVNDHLSNVIQIKDSLYSIGFNVHDYFGKTSGTTRIPEHRIIAFHNEIDFELIKPLIKESLKLGIEYFDLSERDYSFIDADIIIGSYGEYTGKITEDLISQLDTLKLIDLKLFK